jgi:hypothetical protein
MENGYGEDADDAEDVEEDGEEDGEEEGQEDDEDGEKSIVVRSDEDILEAVRNARYHRLTWVKIAKFLNVGVRWLSRWRKRMQFVDPFLTLTDPAIIDAYVQYFGENHPEMGEIILDAKFTSLNLYVKRAELRASVNRVHPGQRERRGEECVQRRVYNVAGPHHLWHLDGNHKLIRYGLIIHGCIDGFSRAVIYLYCADNNRASTVYDQFFAAIHNYGLPVRIRVDKGGENVLACQYFAQARGFLNNPVLVGKSVHNQRIERFWVDLKKDVLTFYLSLFQYFEYQLRIFDPDDQSCVFVLHYLFKQMINQHLREYIGTWNNHKISTENNQRPNQLLLVNSNISGNQLLEIDDPAYYGVELDGHEDLDAPDPDELQQVIVEPVAPPFPEHLYDYFCQYVHPFTTDDKDRQSLAQVYYAAVIFCNQLCNN